MEQEQLIATWISLMTTAVRNACGLSRKQFVALAHKYKIISFLFNNYELLHYYDNGYIVDDVIRYVGEQGGTVNELSRIN